MSNINKNKKAFKFTTSYYRKVKKQVRLSKRDLVNYNKTTKEFLKTSVHPNTILSTPPLAFIQSVPFEEANSFNNNYPDEPSIVSSNDDDTEKEICDLPIINDYMEEEICEKESTDNQNFENKISFIDGLKNWALNYRINHTATTALLKLLNESGELDYMPKCSKTLLRTSTTLNIAPMGTGEYWHNGLTFCLKNSFHAIEKSITIALTFNIDGLPIFNSSKSEFWPILCTADYPDIQPMVVGIYFGDSKPNLQDYLLKFVDELSDVLKDGLIINNHHIKVVVRCFLCDTPARSFIKGTVSSNAYHGCTKCTVIGDFYNNGRHMSYSRFDMPLRTDNSFRIKTDLEHHKQDSPLLKLPINMIDDFPVADSLHLLDLGVMKRCLKGWVHGSFNFRSKLSAREINEISDLLQDCNNRKPAEIHRAFRRLDCLSFWKGLEFRSFLIYLGPIVLRDYLPVDIYHHFLLLSCATIICSCKNYLEYLNIADILLKEYVEKFIDIYGIDSISSNIHNLCHLVKDVEKFGPLPSFSAYPFENYLYRLKYLVRSGNRPLAQIAKRINEFSKMDSSIDKNVSKIPFVRIEHPSTDPKFKKIYYFLHITNGFVLKKNQKDKWFLTKQKEIVAMQHATYYEGTLQIYGASIQRKCDFFDRPFSSSRLNIFISPSESEFNIPKLYALSDIKCKLISLKYQNKFVFMPLIHTLDLMKNN